MKKFLLVVLVVLMLAGGYCFINAKHEEQVEEQRIEAVVNEYHSNMVKDSNGVWVPKDSGTVRNTYGFLM